MSKSPNAFRTISEVSETLDIPAHVLRFWESKFNQIRPVKRGGGRRYYRPEDIDLLRGVRDLLYDDGMTIKGVQKIFKEQGVKHVVSRGSGAAQSEGEGEPSVAAAVDAVIKSKPAPKPEAAEVDRVAVEQAIAKLEEVLERLKSPL
jgi:DNA-binding transcriptional MerR regulator